MKPVKAWAVVSRNGRVIEIPLRLADATWLCDTTAGDRVVRVEVREIPKKARVKR